MTVVTDDTEFAIKLIASGWLREGNVYTWNARLVRQ